MAALAYCGGKNFGFLGTVKGKKMFFCTHIEDQSLRGPLLKALKLVCTNQGGWRGWGVPHLIDIKKDGWTGRPLVSLSSVKAHFHTASIYLSMTKSNPIKASLRAPLSQRNVWESLVCVSLNVKDPSPSAISRPM